MLHASLAHLAQNKVVCDLDVDAPDMHILLDPQVHTREAFVSGNEAVIDRDACRRCGICFEHCRFDAVKKDGDVYGIDPLRCEGCGVCVALCSTVIAVPTAYLLARTQLCAQQNQNELLLSDIRA